MFPDFSIIGLSLYDIFFVLGVIAALLILRLLSDKSGFSAKLFNFSLIDAILSITLGYGSAVLFQAFYNYLDNGIFELTSTTGATFYGGLLGGVAVFFAIYFGVGRFRFPEGEHRVSAWKLLGIAACSITAAHSLGRVGCLMVGCCHGRATDSALGIFMKYPGYRVIPTQLYEALFLALLSTALVVRYLKGKKYNMPIYMAAYGVWRFAIEYLRGDHRGETIISFLTPSQLVAVILVVVAVLLWYAEKRQTKTQAQDVKSHEE